VGRQIAIVIALLVAAGVLLAAMAWATAARAQDGYAPSAASASAARSSAP
jgi:hypothetical protein